jgi:hypothetical protein
MTKELLRLTRYDSDIKIKEIRYNDYIPVVFAVDYSGNYWLVTGKGLQKAIRAERDRWDWTPADEDEEAKN